MKQLIFQYVSNLNNQFTCALISGLYCAFIIISITTTKNLIERCIAFAVYIIGIRE